MTHVTPTYTKLLSVAALTAMLLAAAPVASASDDRDNRNNRGNGYEDNYRGERYDGYRGERRSQYQNRRPIKIYLKFKGMRDGYRSRDYAGFVRQVRWQMQQRSDRRIIFVRNRNAADRVVRINKRQWQRDYRAYARGGYNPNRRYVRYDQRRDPVVQVAFAALEIAHILRPIRDLDYDRDHNRDRFRFNNYWR